MDKDWERTHSYLLCDLVQHRLSVCHFLIYETEGSVLCRLVRMTRDHIRKICRVHLVLNQWYFVIIFSLIFILFSQKFLSICAPRSSLMLIASGCPSRCLCPLGQLVLSSQKADYMDALGVLHWTVKCSYHLCYLDKRAQVLSIVGSYMVHMVLWRMPHFLLGCPLSTRRAWVSLIISLSNLKSLTQCLTRQRCSTNQTHGWRCRLLRWHAVILSL